VAEARTRLQGEGLPAGEAESVLREWIRLGYLDDRRLAYTYLSARSARRLEGRRKLVAELRRRGVAPVLLEEVAAEALDDETEERHLQALVERRLQRDGPPQGSHDVARLVRFLQRRGFETEAIHRVLDPLRPRGCRDEIE
jgi:SOS response regulatory protein OraA/RecX